MKRYERRLKIKFKLLSVFYDLFEIVFWFDQKSNPRRKLSQKIPDRHLLILDVCVGTANAAIEVAKAHTQNEIIGIDLSIDMMKVAQTKVNRHKIKNMSLLQMDATRMGFGDNVFDIVTVSFGLHELGYELMMEILRQMHRVVKNDGTLYIVDYEEEDNIIKKILLWCCLKLFEPKHMSEFLGYDWPKLLGDVGFKLVKKEKCLFSKLISASTL